MTDIVERLLALQTGGMIPVIAEAADEITRLRGIASLGGVREMRAEIERLKIENNKMLCQLEKIAQFVVHPYSAAKAVLIELGKWQEPKP